MPEVNSVSGPIDTADLGFTLMHEHIMVQSPGVKENFPVFDRQAEIDKAVQKLDDVQARGVNTLVDLTVANWRDIPFVKEVVAQSGVQVVVATGLYWEVPYFFRAQSGRSVEFIADLFAKEGTWSGPGVRMDGQDQIRKGVQARQDNKARMSVTLSSTMFELPAISLSAPKKTWGLKRP